jgi:hypothetical protein
MKPSSKSSISVKEKTKLNQRKNLIMFKNAEKVALRIQRGISNRRFTSESILIVNEVIALLYRLNIWINNNLRESGPYNWIAENYICTWNMFIICFLLLWEMKHESMNKNRLLLPPFLYSLFIQTSKKCMPISPLCRQC